VGAAGKWYAKVNGEEFKVEKKSQSIQGGKSMTGANSQKAGLYFEKKAEGDLELQLRSDQSHKPGTAKKKTI